MYKLYIYITLILLTLILINKKFKMKYFICTDIMHIYFFKFYHYLLNRG